MHWIDPDHLPETSGLVDCFLLNGDGEADGFVLTDGTEVHFPPHMGLSVLAVVRRGSALRVRGVRPRGVAMISAVSIVPDEGEPIVDAGPPEEDGERKAHRKQARAVRAPMEVRGVVRQALHGPKGEVRGLLLEDGRAGRFPPHAATSVMALLVPGKPVLLRGDGMDTPHGTVIAVREIGSSADDVRAIDAGEPRPKKQDGKHGEGRAAPPRDIFAAEQPAAHPL